MSIHDLSSLLATERSRLGILLQQVAIHGWANALPAQISGIADARSEIARLKVELRRLGELVADEVNDQEMEEERAQAAASGRGSVQIGDTVGGDKIGGDKVMGDKIINQIVLRPLPVNLRSLVQPLIDHYSADLFGGREAELAMLDSFLADPDQPYGLLVAPTGLGKTALLIHWIARLQQQQPHWKIIFAPISIRYQAASDLTILGILAYSLAEVHHDLEQFRGYDQSAQSLRALIGDYLRRPLPEGMQLLLVLDAIDEATGWEVGPLCAIAPQANLKIVISARQRADRTREDWRFHLGWNTFPVAQLDLHQLSRSAVAALLTQNTLPHANDPAFVDQFYRVSEGDPLTCNLLLKALISGEVTADSLTQRPPGLEAFLKGWVEVLRKRRKASAPIRELLALCAVAYGPLNSDDLQALAPDVFEEQADIGDAINEDEIARFIITVGEHSYVFSHQRLREVFLEQIYPPKDREKLQQRLIDYGKAWYADRSQPLPDYIRQFWIVHLRTVGDWQRIRTVLTEIISSADEQHSSQPWQAARFAAEGSDTAYLADLDVLWRWAEAHNDLALMLRCALIASSLRSRSSNLTPELLVQLVKIGTNEGKWSAAAALEQIAHMPDSWRQAECIKALLVARIDVPWGRVLEIMHTITDHYHRMSLLISLIPHLPLDQINQALQIAQGLDGKYERVHALIALLPFLSPNQQEPIRTEALHITQTIPFAWDRFLLLGALMPYLPSDLQEALRDRAFRDAQTITSRKYRAQAYIMLAPFFPPSRQEAILTEALDLAQAIVFEWDRVTVLATLIPHLPPNQQETVLDLALQTAQHIPSMEYRAQACLTLVSLLPHHQQNAFLDTLLHTIQAIKDEHKRAKTLIALIPLLAPTQEALLIQALHTAQTTNDERDRAKTLITLIPLLRSNLVPPLVQAAQAIKQEHDRFHVLATLSPLLPPNQQKTILSKALQTAQTIDDKEARASLLLTLLPALTSNQDTVVAEVFSITQANSDELFQIRMFTGLIPFLPLTQQGALASQVLDRIQIITDEEKRTQALIRLVPLFPLQQQKVLLIEALQATPSLSFGGSRVWAFTTFLQILPYELAAEALDVAYSFTDTNDQAKALTALLPYLPSHQRAPILAHKLQAAGSIHDHYDRVMELISLYPFLAADQQTIVYTNALQAAQTITNEYDDREIVNNMYQRARAFTALIPLLPPHHQEPICAEALQAAKAISNLRDQTQAFIALVPLLPADQQARVLTDAFDSAVSISDDYARVMALIALAPLLSPNQQANVLTRAFQSAESIRDSDHRTEALIALAPLVSASQQERILAHILRTTEALSVLAPVLASQPACDHLLIRVLRIAASSGRSELLTDLTKLTPWLRAIAERAQQPNALSELASAIIETARCWP